MRHVWILFFLVLLKGIFAFSQENQIFITKDFTKAKEIARGYQKPVVLLFTGSDWCQYSQDLLKHTLLSDGFAQSIKKKYVFVQIDFPEFDRAPTKERLELNAFLKEKFHITEFPTVIFLDPDMQEIMRFGYSITSSGQYANYLISAYEKYNQLKTSLCGKKEWTFEQLKEKYLEAEELGSNYLITGLLNLGLSKDKECFFHLEQYSRVQGDDRKELRRQILSLNSDNRQSVALRLAILDYQEMMQLSPHVALANLLKDVDTIEISKGGLHEKALGWRINRLLAQQLVLEGEFEAANIYAKKALYLSPDRYQRDVSLLIQQISLKLKSDQEIASTLAK
ncbi:MAG: thioredoxin family protein [Chlamydiota bacterium]